MTPTFISAAPKETNYGGRLLFFVWPHLFEEENFPKLFSRYIVKRLQGIIVISKCLRFALPN